LCRMNFAVFVGSGQPKVVTAAPCQIAASGMKRTEQTFGVHGSHPPGAPLHGPSKKRTSCPGRKGGRHHPRVAPAAGGERGPPAPMSATLETGPMPGNQLAHPAGSAIHRLHCVKYPVNLPRARPISMKGKPIVFPKSSPIGPTFDLGKEDCLQSRHRWWPPGKLHAAEMFLRPFSAPVDSWSPKVRMGKQPRQVFGALGFENAPSCRCQHSTFFSSSRFADLGPWA